MKTFEEIIKELDWKAACDAYKATPQPDPPEVAKMYAENKIRPECRTAFLLGFYFGQRVGK